MNSKEKIEKYLSDNGYIKGGVIIKSDDIRIIESQTTINGDEEISHDDNSRYFLTMLEKLEVDKNNHMYIDLGCIWNVGYFKSYDECAKILLNNETDLHEGLYNYAVIERVRCNTVYPENDCVQEFFEYNEAFNIYAKMKVSEEVEKVLPDIIVFN